MWWGQPSTSRIVQFIDCAFQTIFPLCILDIHACLALRVHSVPILIVSIYVLNVSGALSEGRCGEGQDVIYGMKIEELLSKLFYT